MKDQVVIRTSKVVLRPKRREDVEEDYAWRSDEGLAELDAAVPLRQSFQEFARRYDEESRFPTPWSKRFSIDTIDGKHIGNCMCYDINLSNGAAEMGIMIGDRDYWNRSYGYDSVVVLLDHMFSTTTLLRLYLHTLEWNIRARKCFERCGFTFRHMVQRNGKTFAYMDITREYWIEIREERLRCRGGAITEGYKC